MPQSEEPAGEGLKTVSRALDLLGILAEVKSAGVREIARRLEIGPAAGQRLVSTLAKAGFVEQDEKTREYRLGPRIGELAAVAEGASVDIGRIAMPSLLALRDRTGETVLLQRAVGGYRTGLLQLESSHELRMVIPDRPIPILHGPAADQVFRAFSDAGRFSARDDLTGDVPDWEFEYEAGLVDGPDLDAVRARGWASSYGVRIRGGTSVAAPVIAKGIICSLGVFAPSDRLPPSKVPMVGELVAAEAAVLTRRLEGA